MQKAGFLTTGLIFCRSTARFVSDLIRSSEYRFPCDAAYLSNIGQKIMGFLLQSAVIAMVVCSAKVSADVNVNYDRKGRF